MLIDLQCYKDGKEIRHISNQDLKGAYNWIRHTKTKIDPDKVDCQVYETLFTTVGTNEAMPLDDIEAKSFEDVYNFLQGIKSQ